MAGNGKPTDKKARGPDLSYVAFGFLAVVLLVVSVPVLFQDSFEKDWTRETGVIKNGITGPCGDCSITAETGGRFGLEWVVRVRYANTGRVRVLVYESPWKSAFIPHPMTKFYDSLEYGPVDHSFSVGGCGSVFVAVSSVLTREGVWIERQPVVMCS